MHSFLCQSADLNIIENLWIDLKKIVCTSQSRNLTELEDFYENEWGKSLKQELKQSWLQKKSLKSVILTKGGATE